MPTAVGFELGVLVIFGLVLHISSGHVARHSCAYKSQSWAVVVCAGSGWLRPASVIYAHNMTPPAQATVTLTAKVPPYGVLPYVGAAAVSQYGLQL